jgi:glycosyltransferase involved in cell wall biosynthesis
MATGTPVIALDKDDARREHILNSGAGELFNDGRTLLHAVRKILDNWEEYSMRGIQYAAKFSWDDVAKRYLALYEEVLRNESA